MGASEMADRPSLDRLKALDSLPDLELQLHEAKRLCNHNARAEMILRWLMGKLKSSPEACKDSQSWDVLASTLRLISPQRIALLLNQLPGILQTTCSALELPKATIESIAELLNLILELGQGIDGAAIKSLLSMESAAAASFCGNWFRHIFVRNHELSGSMISSSLLSPAVQVWELRKHHDSDDTNFNNHCLVQVLPLLGLLSNGKDTGSKRKRGETASGSARVCERALEALVAKHTILPARSTFFRKTDPQARRLQRGLPQVSIGETLVTLKKAIQEHRSQELIESAPKILDIALRSVSAPTPRHRIKERPWIESVFGALRDCLDGQSKVVTNGALIQLLRAVRVNKATLPVETLAGLVKDSVNTASSENVVDWELAAAVVELDANVLANSASTNEVFDQITKESGHGSPNNARTTIWRDHIILPTLRAYAQSRTLGTFADCWYKQLVVLKSTASWSVCDSIGDSFAEVMESSLPVDTILEQIEQHATTISEASESKEKLSNTETASRLCATLCVLEALLKGVRSDALISSVAPRLETLLNSPFGLSELKGFKTTIAHDSHYWQLLTRIFELWYPRWASEQAERNAFVAMGVSLLSNKSFKSAIAQCAASNEPEGKFRTMNSALAYVATLCHCFNQYGGEDGCSELCTKALAKIAEQKASTALVFVHFPTLLATLGSSLRKELIGSLLQAAAAENIDVGEFETQLKAILCAFQGISKISILEELVSVATEELKTSSKTEPIFMSTIASIDPAALDQTQRTHILDTLIQLPGTKQDQAGASQLQRRLALILKLASLPCLESRLLTDASTLWEIGGLLDQDSSSPTSDAARSTLLNNISLLEEIAGRVLRTWLTTQDREKSRELLVQTSKSIKDRVKSAKKAGQLSTSKAALALMKVATKMTESDARDATQKLMVHRETKSARTYVDLLTEDVKAFADKARYTLADTSDYDISNCISAMEALLDLPDTFLAAAGAELPEHAESVAKAVYHVRQPRMKSELRSRLAAAVIRLEAKSTLNEDVLSASAIEFIEQERPSAREQADVLAAYERNFQESDTEFKLRVTFDTLTRLPDEQSTSTLLLVRAAIRSLTKEDFESASNNLPSTLLQRNLQAVSQGDKLFTLENASQGDDLLARRTALQNLAIIFKDKPFMTNQYGVEQTLHTLQWLLTTYPYPGALYLDITQVLTTLFAHHRSRLQGRFHLVISLLQSLLTHLFQSSKTSPSELSIRQARSLARLLESFSNPPPLRHHRGKTSELVDEARKAQAHAGQFTQYLLHHYCAQVLTGSLGEGVREALLPGVWAVIEAMEVYSEDAIKSLSAAVSNSERAVLRSVYEDWKRFGKWEGL